jgi:VWFA-related protein
MNTRMRLTIAFCLSASVSLFAQQAGQNKDANDTQNFTLSIHSNLVVEAVTVKDKKGNFVYGLTAKDFVLTEDGAPQTIRYCEHQNLTETAKLLAPLTPEESNITIYRNLARTQITTEALENARYKDRRLLALYFDASSLNESTRNRTTESAIRFIRSNMTTVDRIAILRYNGGSVDILQDFTDDRNRLLSILETLAVGEKSDFATGDSSSTGNDTETAFGQDDSEFNIFNTDRQLAALQTAVQMLGHLNEKKSLIFFASGLSAGGIDNQAQMHATVDAAIRAGVAIWTVDARGLEATPPAGDASQASPGGLDMYTGGSAMQLTINRQQTQDSLYALAADTGGKAYLDSNDLTRGIIQAQQAISDYYVLGYYTTNAEPNGKFRRVHLSLAQNQEAKLDYRQGYYAEKEFKKFNGVDRERQLEEALMLEDPITELTIAMEVDYFQLNSAEYFVPIIIKIPGRELALAKRGGAQYTRIDFIGEIKDKIGSATVSNLRDDVRIKLSDATAAELAHSPIEYDTGYTLLPGKYSIKLLVRDNETGRIGTYQTDFTVPNLERVTDSVPISAIVLSTQRVDLKDAIYDAEKAKDRAIAEAVNPLVQDGKKLIPSVTRVIATGHKLYVYFQAYQEKQHEEDAPSPTAEPVTEAQIFAFVTLYQDSKKVYETQPKVVTLATGDGFTKLPFSFDIDSDALPRGQYDCQITVLDPATRHSAIWRTHMMLER